MAFDLNTLLAALSTLATAITPILLALINNRQAKESLVKAQRAEQMHQELMRAANPHTPSF